MTCVQIGSLILFYHIEAKQVDFTKTLNDDQVYNCIIQNYEVLGTDWVKHQWNWLNGVYLSFEDHVKFLIIVSLNGSKYLFRLKKL